MTKEIAKKLLNIYGEAWVTRDPDLIISIFTDDATYNDPHESENIGKEAIRSYWVNKVVLGQKDISFHLRNVWVEGETVIAEFDTKFTDIKRNLSIQITEVAILTIKEEKISSLREYYTTIKKPL